MSGGVDNIYLYILVVNCSILCKDSDTSFSLKRIRVHNSVLCGLIFAICTALLEHFINKGSLTVVNVRDYRNIS